LEKFIAWSDIFKIIPKIYVNAFSATSLENNKIIRIQIKNEFYSNLFRKILINLRPKALIVTCEYCFPHPIMIFQAKKLNIPVFALQHGIITSKHWGYIHTDAKKSEYLPDITCIYGENDRNCLLDNRIYTSKQLVVTGSPRHDVIFSAGMIYSRSQFCKKYNIPMVNRIILLATQSHALSKEVNSKILNIVFSACDSLPSITLLIKPHPGEKKKHENLIKSFVNSHHFNSIILSKDSDTNEALIVSDIILIYNSTIGREAVAFGKPLIVLDDSDYGGYIRDGVGILVSSPHDAISAITNILKNNRGLLSKKEEYIHKYFHAIDGKSTERVVKVIEDIIGEKEAAA
jgi:CDP-glycerol glycerophosphotransferase (TagB/SpsB family)